MLVSEGSIQVVAVVCEEFFVLASPKFPEFCGYVALMWPVKS